MFYDIKNLLVECSLEGFVDSRGNHKGAKLLEMFEEQEKINPTIQRYLEQYNTPSTRAFHISDLYFEYYKEGIEKSQGFLRKIFTFEHNLHLVNAAFKAKKRGVECQNVFHPEQLLTDEADSLIATEGSAEFVFPYNFKELESLLVGSKGEVKAQFLAEARFKFDVYKKEMERKPLTFDGILAYLMGLWILEDVYAIDQSKGVKIVNSIVENENE